MATISFREDLHVKNADKTHEILKAMQHPRDKSIVSEQPPKLPQNAGDIWFKRSKK